MREHQNRVTERARGFMAARGHIQTQPREAKPRERERGTYCHSIYLNVWLAETNRNADIRTGIWCNDRHGLQL